MSSTEKFTKGPWKVGPLNGHCGLSIGHSGKERIATVYLGLITSSVDWGEDTLALPENEEAVANANLIETAPKMYEMLETCRDFIASDINCGPGGLGLICMIDDMLAEARGES